MDQVYGYQVMAETPLVINPRTDCPGLLELHSVQSEDPIAGDGCVFLFRGSLTQQECRDQIRGITSRTNYLLGANKYKYGSIIWDGNEASFTLFSPDSSRGYVRISERTCSCK